MTSCAKDISGQISSVWRRSKKAEGNPLHKVPILCVHVLSDFWRRCTVPKKHTHLHSHFFANLDFTGTITRTPKRLTTSYSHLRAKKLKVQCQWTRWACTTPLTGTATSKSQRASTSKIPWKERFCFKRTLTSVVCARTFQPRRHSTLLAKIDNLERIYVLMASIWCQNPCASVMCSTSCEIMERERSKLLLL